MSASPRSCHRHHQQPGLGGAPAARHPPSRRSGLAPTPCTRTGGRPCPPATAHRPATPAMRSCPLRPSAGPPLPWTTPLGTAWPLSHAARPPGPPPAASSPSSSLRWVTGPGTAPWATAGQQPPHKWLALPGGESGTPGSRVMAPPAHSSQLGFKGLLWSPAPLCLGSLRGFSP